jgi:hypothetical protein
VTRDVNTQQLSTPPAVAVATSGGCSSLSLRYTPSGSTLQVTQLVPAAGNTSWTATLVGSTPWDLGDHVIAVWDNIANTEFSGSSGVTVQ